MLYIFADETYPQQRGNGTQRFIISLIALPQNRWSGLETGDALPSRLGVLKKLIEAALGIGVIVYADINSELVRPGMRYTTAEITDMACRDTAWSVCLMQGIAVTIALLYRLGSRYSTVDVYHDTRDIKPQHRTELYNLVTRTLPQNVRQVFRQEGASSNYNPRFRRLEDVPKQGKSEQRTKFQEGVLIADRLCRLAPRLIERPPGEPIYISNITPRVVNTLSKFTPLHSQ